MEKENKSIKDLLKEKDIGIDKLRVIYDGRLDLEDSDVIHIIQNGENMRKEKNTPFPDFSYEGMVFFYLGANELKKNGFSRAIIQDYLNLSEDYLNLFKEKSRNPPTYSKIDPEKIRRETRQLNKEVVGGMEKIIKKSDNINLLKKCFGDFRSFLIYRMESSSLNTNPKEFIKKIRERKGIDSNLMTHEYHLIRDRMSHSMDTYFSPINESLGSLTESDYWYQKEWELYNKIEGEKNETHRR